MQSKKIGNKFIVRLDKGEEIIESLTKICKENNIKSGFVTGIGAAENVEISYFNLKTKEYETKVFDKEGYEITTMNGNIVTKDGELFVHIHINLSGSDHRVFGGHLKSAVVSVTLEAQIHPLEEEISREMNEEFGLNLLKL